MKIVPAAIVLALAALLAAAPASAQHDHTAGASPYAGMSDREIKALSPEEMEELASGEGMGMALAAELNGLPGPRHVLDLADELGLDAVTRGAVQEVFDAMQAEAVGLGGRIIEEERALDRAFASGTITPDEVRTSTARIGALRGELRAVHLGAHLVTSGLLSAEQRHAYTMLRGYHADAHGGG